MQGDELRLRYLGDSQEPWSGVGHVVKIPDSIRTCIEMNNRHWQYHQWTRDLKARYIQDTELFFFLSCYLAQCRDFAPLKPTPV